MNENSETELSDGQIALMHKIADDERRSWKISEGEQLHVGVTVAEALLLERVHKAGAYTISASELVETGSLVGKGVLEARHDSEGLIWVCITEKCNALHSVTA